MIIGFVQYQHSSVQLVLKKWIDIPREVDKINERLRESEKALELVEPRVPKDLISRAPLKLHPPNRSKRIETKIAKLNKKIGRAKNRRNKEHLITKREALRAELAWGPRKLEGAFSGAYRRYRIDGFSINIEVDKYIDKNGEEKPKEITLRFIDSIKFMSSSLDSLVNNLAHGGSEFFGFENYSDYQCGLLIRKGIYPYEYMDSWDRFEEKHFLLRDPFIASSTCLELAIKIMNMPAKFGEILRLRI